MTEWKPSDEDRALIKETVVSWVAECIPSAKIKSITRRTLGGIDDLFDKGDFSGECTRFAAFSVTLAGGQFYRLEVLFDSDSRLVSFGVRGFGKRWHRDVATEKLVWNLTKAPVLMLTIGGALTVPLAAFHCSGTTSVLHMQFCSAETVERAMPALLASYPSARLRKADGAAYVDMGEADAARLQAA